MPPPIEPLPPLGGDDPSRALYDVLALAMRGGRMGAWSRDLVTNAVWWSPELEAIFGLAPGTFAGTESGFFEYVHEDDRPLVAKAVGDAVLGHTDYVARFRFRHASGEWRWMDGRGRAAYAEDGTPKMLYGIGIDITENERVRQEHAYANAIIASSDDAIISKTLDGIITSWNPAAERLFGYTAAEAIGKPITLVIPIDREDEERDIIQRLRRGERIEHFETIRRAKNGRLIDISLTISPVKDSSGTVVGASKIARDITQRRRSEEERDGLLARERTARNQAEEASRLKDEFLATVSHELRTPLSSILGWAQLLNEGRLDDERARYAAKVVERNARTQVQLINDLLDVSRVVTGQLQLSMRPLVPIDVIHAAVDSVRPMADAKGITIQTVLDRHAGPVSADPVRLQQVIWNLVANAIKFTSKEGRVQVRLAREESHVQVVVSDNGQGITPDFLPYVFDRFRQADSTATRTTGGLGLGLAIVRHLVELHGGRVSAASEGLGRGATFTVELPLLAVVRVGEKDEADRRLEEGHKHPRIPFDGALSLEDIRVLVVDDEPDTRALLREVLLQCEAEVRDAGSASEAMRQVEQWRPHVIISDIGMPVADGYEFIRSVREWERANGTHIPAIALTAYAREDDRVRAIGAGYQTHMPKPVDPVELALAISSLVRTTTS